MPISRFPDLQFSPSDSFEALIEVTRSLLTRLDPQSPDEHPLTESEVTSVLITLLKAEKGPRAFFATYLTSENAIADQPSAAMLAAFESAPQTVGDILVKNLAMSTAMEVHHQRSDKPELAQGSAQVKVRSRLLLERLSPTLGAPYLQAMLTSLAGQGDYTDFLARWGYDPAQLAVIQRIVQESLARIQSQAPSSPA